MLPDLPRWVETRDLLACETCALHVDGDIAGASYVVVDDTLGHTACVVGNPRAAILRPAIEHSVELLAFPENIEHVRAELPGWRAERAPLHVLPSLPGAVDGPRHATRYLEPTEVGGLDHVPAGLAEELRAAEDEDIRIAAALDHGLPVAFCYAGATSETLWDVAIDTIPSHRRRGYAEAAARHLIRDEAEQGRAPVWGALETNAASIGLARKLGFVEVDEIWVLSPR